MHYSSSSAPQSQPIVIGSSNLSSVYALFAIAMSLTAFGIYAGSTFALPILASGWIYLLVLLEFAIVFTARMWQRSSPLNYVLFALFPILSGLTVTPLIITVAVGYANGYAILANAAIATALMTGAAAIFARTTSWNLAQMGGILFTAVIGLIGVGLVQMFVPSLRTGGFEILVSGIGVVVFALFTAYDLQRIRQRAGMGESPFLLALSLYLDIFNLFLYILRFMMATSGNRRQW
jgi:modulator of FtsH protease